MKAHIYNGYVVYESKSEVIAAMLEASLRVTVNSDDPANFPSYMNETLIRVQEEVDLG